MKTFFSSFLGALLGVFIGLLLLGIIVVGMVTSAITDDAERVTSVRNGSVLHVKLDQPIVERGNDELPPIDLGPFGRQGGMGLDHILEDINKAAADDRIPGLFLDIASVAASPASVFQIRDAITAFQDSGKWVIAFSESYSQPAYYLASAADEVYLYPKGMVDWRGLGAELMFFKRMLDEQGIEVQVLRGPDNKYKSAVEPFLTDKMSDPNREQYTALLGDMWSEMLAAIGTSRNLAPATLDQLADSLSGMMPQDALVAGMVDGLLYRDQVRESIRQRLEMEDYDDDEDDDEESDDDEDEDDDAGEGGESDEDGYDEKDIRVVSLADYHFAKLKNSEKVTKKFKKDRIAVVYAVGEIVSGQGDDQTIGSERIAEALRDARTDDRIKAVVMRVNSPGGSALASDVIYREARLIQEAGKPFVVSMGDLAASGGYYISACADRIFANPGTITGSIGVFGMLPNVGPFLENEIGVTTDRVNTNAHTTFSQFTALDERQYAVINASISEIYYTFIELVAKGRGKTVEAVDAMAQGRVWTGNAALELGLVDELGDLDAALAYAAEQAGLDDYYRKDLPKLQNPFEELLKEMGAEARTAWMQDELGPLYSVYEQSADVRRILEWEGPQMRLPYELVID